MLFANRELRGFEWTILGRSSENSGMGMRERERIEFHLRELRQWYEKFVKKRRTLIEDQIRELRVSSSRQSLFAKDRRGRTGGQFQKKRNRMFFRLLFYNPISLK